MQAFEKVQNLDRTGVANATFWSHLDHPRLPQPRYRLPASHIEIDKAHQVLYVVRDGQVVVMLGGVATVTYSPGKPSSPRSR